MRLSRFAAFVLRAYALATALAVLDAVRASGQVAPDDIGQVVGRMSFFVNAGLRFVEETCKMRAFGRLWDRLCLERYGVEDPALRRFRYGVQVNSLGLTESQPENNLQRIVLETLGVTLSRDARARAIQLPAWNEALGLPRPWDQQWSLRIQQVLAYETDLLEYGDIFEGSKVIEQRTSEIEQAAAAELEDVLERGGAFAAIAELKSRLVASQTERLRRIESGEQTVVGVNSFTESEPSPLYRSASASASILVVDPQVEAELLDPARSQIPVPGRIEISTHPEMLGDRQPRVRRCVLSDEADPPELRWAVSRTPAEDLDRA